MSQNGFTAYFVGDETETSFLVDGAGIYLGTGSLFGRKRFAGEHALVYIGTAFIYGSVHGNAAARFDYQSLTLLYLFHGNFFQLSFRSENSDRGRLQSHQFFDGFRCISFGFLFQ